MRRAGLWSGSLLPQQGSFSAAQGHPGRARAENSHGMGRGLRLLPDVALEALVSNGVLPTGCGDGSVSTGCPVPGILLSSHCLLPPWLVMHNPRNMHRKCRPAREAISLKPPRDEPTVSPVPAGGARRADVCRPRAPGAATAVPRPVGYGCWHSCESRLFPTWQVCHV